LSSFDNLETTIASRCGAGLHGRTDEQAGRLPIRSVGREIAPLATGLTRASRTSRLRQGNVLPVQVLEQSVPRSANNRQKIGKERQAATSEGAYSAFSALLFFVELKCLREDPGSEWSLSGIGRRVLPRS
jgi:hypothetical protein